MKRHRIIRIILALFTILGIGFAVAAPASAEIYNYRKLTNFDRPYSYKSANCGLGDAYQFWYDAYRPSSTATRFQWNNLNNGTMRVQVQLATGALGEYHDFISPSVPNWSSSDPTWSVDWKAGLHYWWWMTFFPNGGGSCAVHFYA